MPTCRQTTPNPANLEPDIVLVGLNYCTIISVFSITAYLSFWLLFNRRYQSAGSMHQFLLTLHAKYGPVASFWYGPHYCISIGNADIMKQVKHLFDRPAALFEMVEPLIGKSSIQFASGDEGRRRHKLLAEAMSIRTSERLMPGMIQVK